MPILYAHLFNAFLLTILFIMLLRRMAPALQLVDMPDLRKQHEGAVPLCGGLAIFTAFMVTAIGFPDEFRVPWTMEVGLALLVLMGVADDRWGLSARMRLVLEIVAAYLLVSLAGFATVNLGALTGLHPIVLSPLLGGLFAIFFVVGTINAINMSDGIDGLAGGNVAAALFWLALIAVHSGLGMLAAHELTLLAAVLGFLVFNMRHPWRKKASVFLGDAGSVMLGAVIALAIIRLAAGPHGIPFFTLAWVLAVPIIDTLSLIVRRTAAQRSPFAPDRNHLHHLLLDAGFSHTATAALLTAATAICGAVAYAGVLLGVPDTIMAAALIVPVSIHTVAVLSLGAATSRHRPAQGDHAPSPASLSQILGDQP